MRFEMGHGGGGGGDGEECRAVQIQTIRSHVQEQTNRPHVQVQTKQVVCCMHNHESKLIQ
jgi:hypothetical protein